ncbi:MAG: hypothetical protein D6689_09995, partial [Deltaproteobacteria bacterium]
MTDPATPTGARPPETLAERFWSLAKAEPGADSDDPVAVVRHVLAVLDRLDAGEVGDDVTVNTLSFLHLLRQQEMKGDLLYASPEQVRGEQMDERSLVFSVGVLLFEKLTGRHPFGAEGNPNRVARIGKAELASGVNFFPKVPAALRTVLVKAMGPFPEERYASLAELRAQLEAFVRSGGAGDRAPDPPARKLPAVADMAPAIDAVWSESVRKPEPVFRARVRPPRRYAPALWMLAGAAAATAVFAIAGGRAERPATRAPAPTAGQADSPTAPISAPAAAPPISAPTAASA